MLLNCAPGVVLDRLDGGERLDAGHQRPQREDLELFGHGDQLQVLQRPRLLTLLLLLLLFGLRGLVVLGVNSIAFEFSGPFRVRFWALFAS